MSASDSSPPQLQRLTSLDAYRGFALFLMGLELLSLDEVSRHFPENSIWQFIGLHAEHIAWTGCSPHDLIHPSFAFMVGAVIPFSLANRAAKGDSKAKMIQHALWRSLILIILGVFVHSLDRAITNWTFEDTLTQMGLGYPVLFLLAFVGNRLRWTAIAAILFGYWLFFALHPLAPADFNDAAVNIPAGWPHHFTGFFAHWNLNQNAAWEFDVWLLNQFPRMRPFVGYIGGYNTLNFIPTIGTMVLGLIAGSWLKEASDQGRSKEAVATLLRRLIIAGIVCLGLGLGLQAVGICPIIKKIWTPAWTLFSGGCGFWFMAVFYYVMDVKHHQRWAFPFIVIGTNSIAMYLMFRMTDEFIGDSLEQHLGPETFHVLGEEYQPIVLGACILAVIWLILFWAFRRKIFLKI